MNKSKTGCKLKAWLSKLSTAAIIGFACIALFAGDAFGDSKIESVTSHIPAGVLGLAVIEDLSASCENVDKFLARLGEDDYFLGLAVNALAGDGIMPLILSRSSLGKGFNPAGGAAVVIVDPSAAGIDLPDLVRVKLSPWTGENLTASKLNNQNLPLPIVALLPAKTIADVFPGKEIVKQGRFFVVINAHNKKNLYAVKVGSYVAISPSMPALKYVADAKGSITSEIPQLHVDMTKTGDIWVHLNMSRIGIVADSVIAILDEEFGKLLTKKRSFVATQAILIHKMLPTIRTMLTSQLAQTITLRFAKKGAIIERLKTFKHDSLTGKRILAHQASSGKPELLNRLPSLPYFLATGYQNDPVIASVLRSITAMNLDLIETAFASAPGAKPMNHTEVQRFRSLGSNLHQQITSSQIYIGAAPKGAGLLAGGISFEVKDAKKFATDITQSTEILNGMIKRGSRNEDKPALKIIFKQVSPADVKNQSLGKISLATIDIIPPKESGKWQTGERKKLLAIWEKIFGQRQFRIYLAVQGKHSVIITTGGGGIKMIKRMLNRDDSRGYINISNLGEAVDYFPKTISSITLLNPANFHSFTQQSSMAVNPATKLSALVLRGKKPIVLASGIESDASCRDIIYIPGKSIVDLLFAVMISK